MKSARPHQVRAAPSPPPAPRSPLTRSWKTLTIKQRASACPGGIPRAGRSRTPGRDVCCGCRPLRGARGTPQMLTSSPEPAARPQSWCPAAAPSLPGTVAWSWERSWRSWRSGATRRHRGSGPGRGGSPHCANRGEPLRSLASDLQGGESRAQGAPAAPRPPAPGAPSVFPRALGARSGGCSCGPGCRALIAFPRGWAPLCAGRAGRRGQLWMLQPLPPPPPPPPPAPRLPGRPGGCS